MHSKKGGAYQFHFIQLVFSTVEMHFASEKVSIYWPWHSSEPYCDLYWEFQAFIL